MQERLGLGRASRFRLVSWLEGRLLPYRIRSDGG